MKTTYKKVNLLLVLLLSLSCVGWSCSCITTPMNTAQIANASLVFKGEILKKEDVPQRSRPDKNSTVLSSPFREVKFTIAVKEIIRGKYEDKKIEILTSKDGSSCGANFSIGDNYYVLAYLGENGYRTNLCAQNRKIDRADKDYKKAMRKFKRARCRKKWKNKNGEIIATGKIKKRKPVGVWTFYHSDGTIKVQGEFVKGQKQGEWKFYHSKKASKKHLERYPDTDLIAIENKENILSRGIIYENGLQVGEQYY